MFAGPSLNLCDRERAISQQHAIAIGGTPVSGASLLVILCNAQARELAPVFSLAQGNNHCNNVCSGQSDDATAMGQGRQVQLALVNPQDDIRGCGSSAYTVPRSDIESNTKLSFTIADHFS